MSELAIETRGLTKSFGGVAAVDDLDLRVPQGSVFGYQEPGKSLVAATLPYAGTCPCPWMDAPQFIEGLALKGVGLLYYRTVLIAGGKVDWSRFRV